MHARNMSNTDSFQIVADSGIASGISALLDSARSHACMHVRNMSNISGLEIVAESGIASGIRCALCLHGAPAQQEAAM